MKATRYFDEQVRPRRPYVDVAWCEAALANPTRREVQPDGRIRLWVKVMPPGHVKLRYLRPLTLDDGETVHNALFDRHFQEDPA